MMPLRELQRRFQAHLLERDDAIIGSVVDAPPLPAADRLGIYGHAYRARLRDALLDTYPTLHRILGDDVFGALGGDFIEAHPSVHRSIRWYGRELAEHLAQVAPYAEQPVLAELARFEWTLSEAFDAADARSLDREALAQIAPSAWAGLRFEFHPSLRRLALHWNTVGIWRAITSDEPPPPPESGAAPVPWLIWRRDLKNYFRSLDPAENAALDAALEGAPFGEICAALSGWLADDEVPMRAATLIGAWTDGGIVTRVADAF